MFVTAPRDFRIIAHRGASAYAPENTLPAFSIAKAMGVKEVELDTQLTTDGVVVLCHDRSLERYGHGTALVEEQSLDALLRLDMGMWFSPYFFKNTPMLTLAHLFTEFGDDFTYHIELKGVASGLAQAVYDTTSAAGMLDQVIFTSFSVEHLRRMRALDSGCRLAWLVQSFDDEVIAQGAELQLFQICPPAGLLTESLMAKGRTVAREVRAWGVLGSPQEVRQHVENLITCGCHGMTINWPDWIVRNDSMDVDSC